MLQEHPLCEKEKADTSNVTKYSKIPYLVLNLVPKTLIMYLLAYYIKTLDADDA